MIRVVYWILVGWLVVRLLRYALAMFRGEPKGEDMPAEPRVGPRVVDAEWREVDSSAEDGNAPGETDTKTNT